MPVMKTQHSHALLVAAVALLVRGLYLWQTADSPFFGEPLVDALTYHDLARILATEGIYNDHFLWQAPLYPLALSGLYSVVGVSVAAARLAGALIGVATALMTWRLGCRVLGARGGLAAGLLVAVHGVLVFFETELLATGLTIFWTVTLAWLFVDLAEKPRPKIALTMGLVAALAILTRPVLIPPVVACLVWILWRHRPWREAAFVTCGLLIVLIPFATVNQQHTGHAGIVPPSGAINLYLGNNPDFPATLAIRPGLPWEQLVALPVADTGINDPWVSAAWFRTRVSRYVQQDPGAWLAGLGRKTLHLLSSRELPRNVDIYLQRSWSSVLSVLVWRLGPFGFPAGLLLPLGVLGFIAARRRLPIILPIFVSAYALGLVLVFTAARYRAPLWPLLAVAAVAGVVEVVRNRRWLVVKAALLLLATLPGPFVQERVDLTPELWHGLGFNQLQRNEVVPAAANFRRALQARDDYPEAWNRLGVALARQDSFAASIPCFERALLLAPDYPDPPGNLELARTRAAQACYEAGRRLEYQGRDEEVIAAFREALTYWPDWPEAQARLAWILATSKQTDLRDGAEALALARAALAGHGGEHSWLLEVLAAAEKQVAAEKP